MHTFFSLTKRNIKLFFKDKGLFFSSLITPVILLILYATFLAQIFRDSFVSALPEGLNVSEKLIGATVGGELVSSLLAVSCVTVAFCSNLIMVNDKVTGVRKDLMITPARTSVISLAYYFGTLFNTLIVCFLAMGAGFVYLAIQGWFLSFSDVLFLILDVILLSTFGTALSSIVNSFLNTQGQMSAVGTIVSAGYGFLCGAYMPISNFGEGLQKVLSFLPGTYGTSLVRNHALNGAYAEMANIGFPDEVISGIRDSIDCNLYFFDNLVSVPTMYLILTLSVIALIGIYVLINVLKGKSKK